MATAPEHRSSPNVVWGLVLGGLLGLILLLGLTLCNPPQPPVTPTPTVTALPTVTARPTSVPPTATAWPPTATVTVRPSDTPILTPVVSYSVTPAPTFSPTPPPATATPKALPSVLPHTGEPVNGTMTLGE